MQKALEDANVWITTAKQRLLATQTLGAVEERLRQQQFQRVHRNAGVNVNHVRCA